MHKEAMLVDTLDDIQTGDGVRRSSSRPAPSAVRMTLRTVRAYVATTVKSPRVLLSRRRYLLLLSHPRCFTSLLSHILGSHPEICGSCELHQPYRDHRDLLRLRYMTYWLNDHRVDVRYLLDKVLFNTCPISSRILNRPDVKILFTIRKPAPTITSIVKLGLDTRMRGRFWEEYQEPCRACDLYIARLHALEETCLAMKGKAFYFDGEDLIDRTEVILEALQRYLDLRQPLSEHYRTFGHTGVECGDISERIKSGRIDRSRSDGRNDFVPEHLIDRAQKAYEHCRALLRERCFCV